jgi:Ca2+-binding RTX toxin-like protein
VPITLLGSSATATLIGGAGADHFDGEHLAVVSYAENAVAVRVDLNVGHASGGDADGDTMTNINRVIGSAGGDRLNGNAGDDILVGRGGADQMIGGAGIDAAAYGDSAAGVQVDLGLGVGHGGSAEGDTLAGIEGVVGSYYDDVLVGDAGANGLWGDLGNDTLWGAGGVDSLKGGAGNDVLDGGLGADRLDGGDGIDTASYLHSSLGVTVDLGTGLVRFGDAEGDLLVSIENLSGSARGDTLTGNSGANMLSGEDSNDRLTGAGGADVLNGGLGGDLFTYRAVGDSTVAVAGRDTIQDFNSLEGDKIDLSQIDADGHAANGDTAFHFLGGSPFSGAGAEIRVTAEGPDLLVQGDVNGDKVADFAILAQGTIALTAADFVL